MTRRGIERATETEREEKLLSGEVFVGPRHPLLVLPGFFSLSPFDTPWTWFSTRLVSMFVVLSVHPQHSPAG